MAVQVLVVGAGPTGLALSCGLLAAGVEVRIVDGAQGPATTSRALGLQPRGVEVLDRLGALADLPDRSVAMAGSVVHVGGKEKARLALPRGSAASGARAALVISQAEIEAQLRERVGELGGRIEWGRELTGAEQDGDGVTARLGAGRIRADWLVGCDGAHSGVRGSAGIRLVGDTGVERFLLADVHLGLPTEPGFASMWAEEDGMLAAVPLPGRDRWRIMAPIPVGEPDEMSGDAVLAVVAKLLARCVGDGASTIRGVEWTSTFRVHRRLADAYRRGRMFLAGDAAHIHGPVGGQGMNTGMGDAENLAWKLALVTHQRAGQALLDSYEAERRPVAAGVIRAVGGLDRLLLSKNPLVALLREHVMLAMVNRPSVQRLVWQKGSQLGITYRRGPLAQHPARKVHGRRSGDRVPDLPCVRADGGRTRLHAELGGRWALLAGKSPATATCVTVVRERLGADRVTELALIDGGPDQMLLVRPDGHLGWQGAPDPRELNRWLDTVLLPGRAG